MSQPDHDHDHDDWTRVWVKPIKVMEVSFNRGHGCCAESMVRRVRAYYDLDGVMLWEDDPIPKSGPSQGAGSRVD